MMLDIKIKTLSYQYNSKSTCIMNMISLFLKLGNCWFADRVIAESFRHELGGEDTETNRENDVFTAVCVRRRHLMSFLVCFCASKPPQTKDNVGLAVIYCQMSIILLLLQCFLKLSNNTGGLKWYSSYLWNKLNRNGYVINVYREK